MSEEYEPKLDRWAHWLLDRRYGGDPRLKRSVEAALATIRESVLDGARLTAGETLLDIGCGDGLIGFGALERVGLDGVVIFSDISEDLLAYCRTRAADEHVLGRCRFVAAPADNLVALDDACVDAVTTRSVLIYVADKAGAFREFHRLRPGGRVSLFEPINSYFDPTCWWPYDTSSVQDLVDRVWTIYRAIQPATDPMLDFGDRDLVRFADDAGFSAITLNLQVEIKSVEPIPWSTFLRQSGNPCAPSHEEAFHAALSDSEVEQLCSVLRPLVEHGRGTHRTARAWLLATKDG